jgi:predicted RND superfamily exporter protein
MPRYIDSGWAKSTVQQLWLIRRWLALLALMITCIFAYEATGIRIDNSLSAWFVEDSELLRDYHRFLDKFGSDDLVFVALERDEGFASIQGAKILRVASDGINKIPEVSAVLTFLDITDTVKSVSKYLFVPTLEELDDKEKRLNYLLADPLINGRLISADGRTALLILRLQTSQNISMDLDSFRENLKKTLESVDASNAAVSMSMIYTELNALSRSEMPRLLGIALVLMSFILLLSLGQLIPVLVALSSAMVAVVWTFGILRYSGGSINVLTSVVPTVILVIGISTCVHIFLHLQSLPPEHPPTKRVVEGMAFILKPCIFAAATTAAGFASLTMAGLPMTRELGMLLATGIAAVFLLITLITLCAGRYIRSNIVSRNSLSMLAMWLAKVGTKRPKLIVFLFGLLGVVAIWGTLQIKIDAFPLDLFPLNHPVREDADRIENTVGPYTTLEFVVSAEDDVLQLHHLRAAEQWANSVVDNGHAAWSASLLEGIKRSNQLRSGGYPRINFQLPTDEEQLQYILKSFGRYTRYKLEQWFSPPHQLRFTFGVRSQPASGLSANLDAIMALAPPEGLLIEPAGLMPLWLSQVPVLVGTQIKSFALALVLIMGIIIVMLRRMDMVVLAVVVNLLPVLATLGFMGIAGIRLDLGTVAVASVILGLVVDDTIHFLHRLKHEVERDNSLWRAVRRTASSTGYAIVVSSIVIGVGFGVLGFAQVTSIAWFGLLIGMATFSALLADLSLAPALLTLMNRSPRSN